MAIETSVLVFATTLAVLVLVPLLRDSAQFSSRFQPALQRWYATAWFWWAVWRTNRTIRATFHTSLEAYHQRPFHQEQTFVDPPMHGLTQKICACSLRYLLPKKIRRWILSWFISDIPEKSALMGHTLVYDIVCYFIRFHMTKMDVKIVQPDDATTLLEKVRAWAPANHLEFPTVAMNVGEETPLSVSYFPLSSAIAYSDPPIYDTSYIVHHEDPTIIASKIPVFISHPWATADNPNRTYDFDRVLGLLLTTIQCCVQASVVLLRSGFPLKTLLTAMEKHPSPWVFPITRNVISLHVDQPEFKDENGNYSQLPSISGKLTMAVFKASAKVVLKSWRVYKSIRTIELHEFLMSCYLEVMNEIWLWYDYTCLPQRPLRYTDDKLQILFKRSLSALPIIQVNSHTFTLNSSKDFMTRAWCYAEYHNVQGVYGRSEMGKALKLSYSEDETKTMILIENILQATNPLTYVLTDYGLKFTNDAHADKCTTAICWVLWNNILRNPSAFLPLYYGLLKNPYMCVGIGYWNHLSPWIKFMVEAIEHPFRDSPRVSLLTGQKPVALSYNMEEWSSARMAIQENLKNFDEAEMKSIFRLNINYSAETGGLPSALTTALRELEARDNCARRRGEKIAFMVVLVNLTPLNSQASRLHQAARYDLNYEISSQNIFL